MAVEREMKDLVTAITVNFKTPDLLRDCVTTFGNHYPGVRHLIIDNGGGCAESLQVIDDLIGNYNVFSSLNSHNVGHGPALNQALALVGTPYAFILDSDTRVERSGFLEKMTSRFDEDWTLFATGWLRWVNPSGVAFPDQDARPGMAYIHPFACMIDTAKFSGLAPFHHCGASAINLMRDALAKGYTLSDFPIHDYIWHKVAGTRGHYGGRWQVGDDEEPGEWNRHGI